MAFEVFGIPYLFEQLAESVEELNLLVVFLLDQALAKVQREAVISQLFYSAKTLHNDVNEFSVLQVVEAHTSRKESISI